jgi:sarcosine oxidase subunit delta
MILLPCAWCGPRDASEFQHVGEVITRPDPAAASPAQWRGYLYLRANPCGWTRETWYHRMGCRRYITVERHTETNEVRAVSASGAGQPQAPGPAPLRGVRAGDPPPSLPTGAPPARPSGAPAREAGKN